MCRQNKDEVAMYLVSIFPPLMKQGAVPDPLGFTIIQTSHSKTFSIHSHPVKIYAHCPAEIEREINDRLLSCLCLNIHSDAFL